MNKSLFNNFMKSIILATSFCLANLLASEEIPKALPLESTKAKKTESANGVLYRINPKDGKVKVIPISKKMLSEHNIDSGEISKEEIAKLAKLDEKKVLKGGVTLNAVARKENSKDEFNDQDASAKTALYFSFGFGRPRWGGCYGGGQPYYHNYYNNYCSTPYYYGGYYAPRVMYVEDVWYRPVCRPYYYSSYYYSYYNYSGYY